MAETSHLIPVRTSSLPHPCVVATIGLAAAGLPRLGLDRLRGVVGVDESDQDATARAVRAQALLLLGHGLLRRSVVVDDTSTTSDRRRRLTSWARRCRMAPVAVPFGHVPLAEAHGRNDARSEVPGRSGYARRVPGDVLHQQSDELAGTNAEDLAREGFTHVVVLGPEAMTF